MTELSRLAKRLEPLAARAPKGLFRFLCVGMAGLATHTLLFTLLSRSGLGQSPSWFAGFAIATVVTWRLNRRLTFAVVTGRRPRAEMLRYVLVTLVAQAVSFAMFKSVCMADPRLSPSIALVFGAVVATFFSYTGQRFFTFAPRNVLVDGEPITLPEVPIA